jgi:hypothetical protein
VFFFWILIYIEKEEKMKISCNRVFEFCSLCSQKFLFGIFVNQFGGVFWWGFLGVFARDFCGFFVYQGFGSFGVFGIYMVT